MEDKKAQNTFKFTLFLKNDKISESIFNADLYNPVVRYSVNIREMIPNIISSLQGTLQTKSDDLDFEMVYGSDGEQTETVYNTMSEYLNLCQSNGVEATKLKQPMSQPRQTYANGGKKVVQRNGIEFKFGLYINSHTIVERNFYVDDYNPESRFSVNLKETISKIVGDLEKHLKNSDLNHMWDDNKIISVYHLNIQEVRDLTRTKITKEGKTILGQREELLSRTNDFLFVDEIKRRYNKAVQFAD